MIISPRFFLIGTKYDRSEDVLPQMLLNGVISTGFVDDLDLSPIIGIDYENARAWINDIVPQESSTAKNTLARFAGIHPGDLVALKVHSAPSGNQSRLVIARYAVVTGFRKAIYALSKELGHTLKVDFLDEQQPLELALGYGATLHTIEIENRIGMIFGRYAEFARAAAVEAARITDKATHISEIAARGAYLVHRTHNALQNELRELLVAQYGETSVKQEEDYVDLKVFLPQKTLLFEVKSSPSPLTCVREAIGQLLHYSWTLGLNGKTVTYVVVGPSLATKDSLAFIDHVSAEIKVELIYCTPSTFTYGME